MFTTKPALLFIAILCGDITPQIDDKFESENHSGSQAIEGDDAAQTRSASITLDAARALDSLSADDTALLIQHEDKKVLVLGKVHSVYIPKSGSPVILNLGSDFKTCAKAIVPQRSIQRWKRSSAEIGQLYQDQTIVIEGTVGLYKGLPQIELNSPSQIRIIQ